MPQENSMPEAGEQAPGFTGTIQDGSTLSLADYAGKKLALYFYPRDNTPGCTVQACNLRDHYGALSAAGVSIIGVSDDPVGKHLGFSEKHDLPFPLIADIDRSLLIAYGAYGEKNLYGRKSMGTKRTTFLIDETGVIQKVIKRPKTGDHAAEILRGFSLAE